MNSGRRCSHTRWRVHGILGLADVPSTATPQHTINSDQPGRAESETTLDGGRRSTHMIIHAFGAFGSSNDRWSAAYGEMPDNGPESQEGGTDAIVDQRKGVALGPGCRADAAVAAARSRSHFRRRGRSVVAAAGRRNRRQPPGGHHRLPVRGRRIGGSRRARGHRRVVDHRHLVDLLPDRGHPATGQQPILAATAPNFQQ